MTYPDKVLLSKGYYKWQKGTILQLSSHFVTTEFECAGSKSGDLQCISQDLVQRLQNVRNALKMPLSITSAYRTAEYQLYLQTLGYKTSPNSQHLLGNAVDVTCRDMDKLMLICECYFKSIGIAKSFLHLDTRDDKIRRWSY